MRRTSDMPSKSRLPRLSGRLVLVALALSVLVVIVFGRALARFYVDALWFDSLGHSDVFWGQITAKLTLFGVDDPQFGVDVGFYVFRLPFLSFAIDWLFAALVIVLLLTLAAHLINA